MATFHPKWPRRSGPADVSGVYQNFSASYMSVADKISGSPRHVNWPLTSTWPYYARR